MKKIIAVVKLSRNKIGYYDPLTRIHLTIADPTAEVTSDLNVSNLKEALKYGVIQVTKGDLDGETDILEGEIKDGNSIQGYDIQEAEQAEFQEAELQEESEQVVDEAPVEVKEEKVAEPEIETKKRSKKSK